MANKGKLYLIPNVISESTQEKVIPVMVREALPAITHFLAEDIRSARRYLSSLKVYPSIEDLNIEILNKDTSPSQLSALMSPLTAGFHLGVISESGCPGVADPGALAVNYAHQHSIQVVPLVGPSSILLALMGSGLNGQRFAFHGYLPIDAKEATHMLKELERESRQKNQTQIFIETPYRNNSVFAYFLKNLHSETILSVALDITGPQEFIQTSRIADWIKQKPIWAKSPAVFLFLA
jgi:16S rRNA (cytidine1402-2'-O)-methyltransferase